MTGLCDSGKSPRTTRSGSLDYLDHAATTVAMLIHAGADEAAGELLDDLLAAIDRELVARGNSAPERPLFEDLLLAAQRARELVPVPASKEMPRGRQ